MENQERGHITYIHTSRNESIILQLIDRSDLTVFGNEELGFLTGWKKARIHNTLYSLVKKKIVTRVRKNCYTLTDRISENLFEIATESITPSYISFWTALSYYGFTEQQPSLVQLVTTKQLKEMNIGSHIVELTTWQPKRLYGYKKEGRFVIAEKEKALVDSMYQPDKCGGLDEYVKCLKNSWEELNKKRFMDYLVRFGNKSLVSRAGYMIENLELNQGKITEKLEKHRTKGYVKLDPKGKNILRYDHKWKVIVTREIGGIQ